MNALLLFPNTRIFFFIGLFLLFIGISFHIQIQKNTIGKGLVTMFDVPGESFFIQLPHGHNILIDGGENTSVTEKISKKLPFWEKHIDVIIISHPDKDHIEGVFTAMKQYTIGTIFLSGVHHNSNLTSRFQKITQEKNIKLIFTHSKIDFRIHDFVFDIVFPKTSNMGKIFQKVNNSSLVVRMYNKNNSILFTGDIEKKTENTILSTPAKLKSDILKVAHHGSHSSTTLAFLKAVSPKKALISAHHDNVFGHPSENILKRLSFFSVSTFVTKKNGEVTLSLVD